MGKKSVRRGIAAAVLLLALLVGLLCARPVVTCKEYVTPPLVEAAERQARGLYSARLPLIPIHVSLDRMEQGTVYYTIRYFPFGTVGMSYSEEGLYNIEKPLTGL